MEISIICPVYNSGKFINKCLKTILNQTFTDWELIVVDDCGKDNAIDIVKRFQEADNRIRIVHHHINQGVDQARFTGINLAKGKYLMFVDSDDWLPHNALELLINKIKIEDSDVVFGGMQRVLDNLGIIKSKSKNNYSDINLIQTICNPELFEEYFISFFGVNRLQITMWAKLYKKQTILDANLQPTLMKMGEDLMFNMHLFPYLKSISFVPQSVYYYRYGGMTTTSNPSFLMDIKKQYLIKQENILKYNYFKAIPFIKYELINCFYSHFQNLILLDNKPIEEVRNLIQEELNDKLYHEVTQEININEKCLNLKNKDVDAIVKIIFTTVKKQKNIHRMKKIISNLIN